MSNFFSHGIQYSTSTLRTQVIRETRKVMRTAVPLSQCPMYLASVHTGIRKGKLSDKTNKDKALDKEIVWT